MVLKLIRTRIRPVHNDQHISTTTKNFTVIVVILHAALASGFVVVGFAPSSLARHEHRWKPNGGGHYAGQRQQQGRICSLCRCYLTSAAHPQQSNIFRGMSRMVSGGGASVSPAQDNACNLCTFTSDDFPFTAPGPFQTGQSSRLSLTKLYMSRRKRPQHLKSKRQELPSFNNNGQTQQQRQPDPLPSSSPPPPQATDATMSTCLALIPPDHVWDTIQRARHLARDVTYHTWPPSIRLFHPFVPHSKVTDVATAVASLVEKYDIEPFTITLDQLVILPHLEVLEEETKQIQTLPQQYDDDQDDNESTREMTDDKKVRALIEREAQIGRDKSKRRQLRERMKKKKNNTKKNKKNAHENHMLIKKEEEGVEDQEPMNIKDMTEDGAAKNDDYMTICDNNDLKEEEKEQNNDYYNGMEWHRKDNDISTLTNQQNQPLSPQEVVEKQKQMRSKFNGPCIMCLEPDLESRTKLIQLRELLRRELFPFYDIFSAASSVSMSYNNNNNDKNKQNNKDCNIPESVWDKHARDGGGSTYRPLLTIGSFSTVSKAIKVAKRLQNLWEPLSFNVTDLHFISRNDGGGKSSKNNQANDGQVNDEELADNREYQLRKASHGGKLTMGSGAVVGGGSSAYVGEERHLSNPRTQFGCDAMVMLMGEEQIEEPDEEDAALLDLLMSEAGAEGGMQLLLDNYEVMSQQEKRRMQEKEQEKQHQQRRGGSERTLAGFTMSLVDDEENGDADADDAADFEALEDLLDDDDEWDEGATVVIGRTHFFMGEMRLYVGMPATSTMDGKDRVLGENVSGSARRKGAVHRQGDRWKEGEFGHRDKDYLH